MSPDFLLALLATGLAAVSGSVSILRVSLDSVRLVRVTKALENLELDATLDDPDLHRLGRLLSDDLGGIEVADYARDNEVQTRFKSLINGILAYLEEPENADEPTDAAPPSEQGTVLSDDDLLPLLHPALHELTHGETWNGLAQLRRTLEIELRKLDPSGSERRATGAGVLARELAALGLLDTRDLRPLTYAINVCSRGIHGFDVSRVEAFEALAIADRTLRRLGVGSQRSIS